MSIPHNRPVAVGRRTIGPGQPCYLITEVGTTCLGDVDHALRLVQAAADAGMDAVKFQMIDPEQLSDSSVTYRFSAGGQEHVANMKEMFTRLGFTDDAWRTIRDACEQRGVDFFATVDYLDGVDRLDRLGVPAHKMGAWDVTYRQLVERIGATGKTLFVDLGPANLGHMDDLIAWFRGAGGQDVIFLHDFHTSDDRQMNLRAMAYLLEAYPWPSGYSAPARDHDLDFAALALGAQVIEKRLILDRRELAFHADESLEPNELRDWVTRLRHVERALGRKEIRPSDADADMARKYFRSLCTLRPVAAGERLTTANLGAKRPGTGIPTDRQGEFVGRVASRDLPVNHLLAEGDVA
ncbi:MAG TPA: N-acetylneuraminate synthase family protein [Rhodocyclaceae bacterium]|nr:N-acetylneuraminate synthase family protein [Rhodocyclaceae bacterium]